MKPAYGPRFSRRTVFDAVLESRAAHLHRMIETTKQDLASRYELELLHHILGVLEGLDDRTRPQRQLGA